MTDISGNTPRFPFNQKFPTFWGGSKWYGNFLGLVSLKSENCWIFWNSNLSSRRKIKWNWNFHTKFLKIWVYLARLSSFLEILENAVPFISRKCQKFNSKLRSQMESAHFMSWNVVETSSGLACSLVNIYMLCFSFYLDPWKTEQSLRIVWCKLCKEP